MATLSRFDKPIGPSFNAGSFQQVVVKPPCVAPWSQVDDISWEDLRSRCSVSSKKPELSSPEKSEQLKTSSIVFPASEFELSQITSSRKSKKKLSRGVSVKSQPSGVLPSEGLTFSMSSLETASLAKFELSTTVEKSKSMSALKPFSVTIEQQTHEDLGLEKYSSKVFRGGKFSKSLSLPALKTIDKPVRSTSPSTARLKHDYTVVNSAETMNEPGFLPYQNHRRMLGWKLTSQARRKDLISLLDVVNASDLQGETLRKALYDSGLMPEQQIQLKPISQGKPLLPDEREITAWQGTVSRLIRARVSTARQKAVYIREQKTKAAERRRVKQLAEQDREEDVWRSTVPRVSQPFVRGSEALDRLDVGLTYDFNSFSRLGKDVLESFPSGRADLLVISRGNSPPRSSVAADDYFHDQQQQMPYGQSNSDALDPVKYSLPPDRLEILKSAEAIRRKMVNGPDPPRPFSPFVESANPPRSPNYHASYLHPEKISPIGRGSDSSEIRAAKRKDGLEEDSRSTVSISSQVPLILLPGQSHGNPLQSEPFLQRIHSSCLSMFTGEASQFPSQFTAPPPSSLQPSYAESTETDEGSDHNYGALVFSISKPTSASASGNNRVKAENI